MRPKALLPVISELSALLPPSEDHSLMTRNSDSIANERPAVPYKEIVDTMNDALIVVDPENVITYANHSFVELIGYPLGEIIGRPVFDFLDEENAQVVRRFSHLREEGVSSQYTLDWVHWTGDKVNTVVSATPMFDGDRFVGSFAVITDITRMRLEQEKRIRSERRFRTILETMHEAVLFLDADWRVKYGNPRLFEMLGYSPDELLGKSLLEIVDPSELGQVKTLMAEPPSEGTEVTLEIMFRTADGRRVHSAMMPRVITDQEEEFVGVIAVVMDISDLKRIHRELQTTEARYRTFFDEMPVGIVVVTPDGNIISINKKGLEILGARTPEDVAEINFLTSEYSIQSGIADSLRKCVESKQTVVTEHEYVTRFGRRGFGQLKAHPVLDEDGNVVEVLGLFDDITEKKRMEAALQESEMKYRALAEHSLQGISIIQNQHYVYVNPAFCDIVGRSREEILAMSREEGWSMVHPDDQPYLLEIAQRRRAGKPFPVPYQYRFIRPDGSVRWVEAFSNYIDFGGREALQVVVVDITEKKEAQDELVESREKLQLILETIPLYVYWKDRNSVYLGCNTNFARVAGVKDPSEIVGKTDHDLAWLPEEAESYIATDRRVIESGAGVYGLVERQHQADGREVWIETNKVPLHDVEGNIIGVLGTAQDITERRARDQAIRRSEMKYRSLAENSLQGLAVLSTEGLLYANRPLLELLGVTIDEFRSIPLEEMSKFIYHEDRETVSEILRSRFQGEPGPSNLEFRLVGADGKVRWVEAFISSVDYEGARALQVVLIDITDRVEAEKRVRSARDQADLYLDIISHDIRNHLQVILSSANLLRNATDDASRDSFLQIMTDSVNRVSRLIQEVRATEQLHSVPLEKRDLLEAVDNCIKGLSQGGASVKFYVEREVDKADVLADSYLELLIANILMNAVEHNPHDVKKVWVRVFEDGDWYVISVADNGTGVPDSAKRSLFDRARRFGGLGLHHSRQIVEKYGGRITVRDRVPGDHTQGAEFLIWIPKVDKSPVK